MTTISTLPTPPSRTAPTTFATLADALLGALPAFVTETNAVAGEVNAKNIAAATSAGNALASEMSASASAITAGSAMTTVAWVSGTTYAIGDARWSPKNYFPYRRKTAGAGTTDPSLDTANWVSISIPILVSVEQYQAQGGL